MISLQIFNKKKRILLIDEYNNNFKFPNIEELGEIGQLDIIAKYPQGIILDNKTKNKVAKFIYELCQASTEDYINVSTNGFSALIRKKEINAIHSIPEETKK